MSDSEYSNRERVGHVLSQHSKRWSKENWIRIKEDLRDCVWVEGALLEHPDADRIYFAPEPTQFGLIFEVRKSDVREALPTGQTRSKLGDDYDFVRIYIHKDAILVRMDWVLASKLPTIMQTLKQEAVEAEKSNAGIPLTTFVEVPNGGGKGGGASPSPEPKGGGSGSGSSGVRG